MLGAGSTVLLALRSLGDWAAGAEKLSLLWWDDGYEVYGYGDSVGEYGMFATGGRTATLIARGETSVLVPDYQLNEAVNLLKGINLLQKTN